MKELIQEAIKNEPQATLKKLALAEFLQHLVLQSLYRHGAFENLVFTGGTALRILYHTNRYSEDLDFSMEKEDGFEFKPLLEKVQKDLAIQNLPFEFTLKGEKTVSKTDIRFSQILKEFSLSSLHDQKLTIKLEVDKNPPKGGVKELLFVSNPVSYNLVAYDLPSLFATKLHAIFFRRYTKGRDYFDLVWYLGKGIKPNFKLLSNAIHQTEGKGHEIVEADFKSRLIRHLEKISFKEVRAEAERFAMKPDELKFLDLEPIKSLLRNY